MTERLLLPPAPPEIERLLTQWESLAPYQQKQVIEVYGMAQRFVELFAKTIDSVVLGTSPMPPEFKELLLQVARNHNLASKQIQ